MLGVDIYPRGIRKNSSTMNQTIGVQMSGSSAAISNSPRRGHNSRPMMPSTMPRISPTNAVTTAP